MKELECAKGRNYSYAYFCGRGVGAERDKVEVAELLVVLPRPREVMMHHGLGIVYLSSVEHAYTR